MIAYENVWLSFFEIFLSVEFIADKGKDAEDAAPKPQKKISNPPSLLSEEKRQHDSGKQNNHEYCKDKEYPDFIQYTENGFKNFQRRDAYLF